MSSDGIKNSEANAQPKDGTFSLEDLDKIIESEDPNFAKEMAGLKSQGIEGSAALENLSIATDDDTLVKEEDAAKNGTRKEKIIAFIKRPFVRLKSFIKEKALNFKNRTVMFAVNAKDFFRHELPDRIRYWRAQFKSFIAWVQAKIAIFKGYSRGQKIAIVFAVFSTVGSISFLFFALRGNFLPSFTDNLPRSLGEHSPFKGFASKINELQDFYEAFPEVEYHLLLNKVVVNLKPDENSGPNPMGIFEFYVGIDSKDTALEVKEREKEMLDVIQRTIEDFTYSEVASEYGKVRMKASIKDNINRLLNQGFVYKVYFNQIVFYSNK